MRLDEDLNEIIPEQHVHLESYQCVLDVESENRMAATGMLVLGLT